MQSTTPQQQTDGMQGFLQELTTIIKTKKPNKDAITKIKMQLSKQYKLFSIPSDIELLMNLQKEDFEALLPYLASKPTRNLSGVHVVAVMSMPHNCPHGTCTMCPGGLNSPFGNVPKSYTGNEPATMRAIRNHYDPYLQVFNRLQQYVLLGIFPQKIELILMGGTFLWLEQEYKIEFITGCYQAMNDFSRLFYDSNGNFLIAAFKEYFALPAKKDDRNREAQLQAKILAQKQLLKEPWKMETLRAMQQENDLTSQVKCIGLTIETKPDYGKAEHGNEMLSYGCTRVELGVQSLYDAALIAMHRGHSLADTKESIAQLRDLGFKLNFHVMLGVPGITDEQEIASLPWYFSDPAYRPDMMKIYPLMVMPGTALEQQWKAGKYKPLETQEAAERIATFTQWVEPYCRIMRVQRDIPPKYSRAGVQKSNLRQDIDARLKEKQIQCKCIRCREIGTVLKQLPSSKAKREVIKNLKPHVYVQEYEAAGGTEYFISKEDKEQNILLGFVRMRFPKTFLRPEITKQSALIRELHVYGITAGLILDSDEKTAKDKGMQRDENSSVEQTFQVQHKGIGKELMQAAETIARNAGKTKMVVISGIGVRGYYRKLGYVLEGPYMVKELITK
ncbi:MAG: tRNA uridine(34) 5-carboxymethylaminomethyl modification radical SAM/GNAT enzyme Elp3 [Candidatus Woesearchaeota archaeon]